MFKAQEGRNTWCFEDRWRREGQDLEARRQLAKVISEYVRDTFFFTLLLHESCEYARHTFFEQIGIRGDTMMTL